MGKGICPGNSIQDVVCRRDTQNELEQQINVNIELLNVGWYRNSRGQVPSEHIKHYLLSSEYGGLSGQNPFGTNDTVVSNPDYEYKQYYFHPDHLGSSSFLTDVIGETYQHVEYLPFGEIFLEERNTQQDRNTYLYNGKELDEETGLYYYGARFYDAQLGRWHSVDPKAEKYLSMSPYNYVSGNPIILFDPDGRKIKYSIWNGREFNNRMREHIKYMKEHGYQELRDRIIAMEKAPKKVKIKASKSLGDFGYNNGTIYM